MHFIRRGTWLLLAVLPALWGQAALAEEASPSGGGPFPAILTVQSNKFHDYHLVDFDVRKGEARPLFDGSQPAWSPDGSRVAVVRYVEGAPDILIVDADGANPVNVTGHPAHDEWPTWSPDGERIAFVSNRTGNEEIFVLNVDTKEAANLTRNPAVDTAPAWSPDGKRIAFASSRLYLELDLDATGREILVMNADGSGIHRVPLAGGSYFCSPAWSPDGSLIAFSKWFSDGDKIFIAEVDGTTCRQLIDAWGMQAYPAWSSDGRYMAFVQYRWPLEDLGAFPGNLRILDSQSGRAETVLTDTLRRYASARPNWRTAPSAKPVLEEVLRERCRKLLPSWDRKPPTHLERQQVLARTHELGQLADSYRAAARYWDAEKLYRTVVDIRAEVLGQEHPDYALALASLACVQSDVGDYARAEHLVRQAVELLKKNTGEASPYYASGLSGLAELHRIKGEYAEAERLAQQALGIRKRKLGEDDPRYVSSLHGLAIALHGLGGYTRAEELLREAIGIEERAGRTSKATYRAAVGSLGWLYFDSGEFARAEPLLQEALDLTKKACGEEHPAYGSCLCNLGEFYRRLGDYARAEELVSRGLRVLQKALGDDHPDCSGPLEMLAVVYLSMGEDARAESLLKRCLEIRKKAYGDDNPRYANGIFNLATLCDNAREVQLCQQAYDIFKRSLGPDHEACGLCLQNLAASYLGLGDYSRAVPHCQRAIEIFKRTLGEDHPRYANTLCLLGVLHTKMGEYALAEPLIRQALAVTRRSLEDSALVLSERQQLAMGQSVRHQLDDYVKLGIEAKVPCEPIYQEVLSWKGATLRRQRLMRQAAAEEAIAAQFQALQRVARQLGSLTNRFPREPELQQQWRERVRQLTEEKERLEAKLSAASDTFREARHDVSLGELAAAMPPQAALVDFLESSRSSGSLVAFVVRPGRAVKMVDLGKAALIGEAIDTWRESLGASAGGAAAGALLRTTVWEPLLPHVEGAETILVSADGALGRMPLAALPGKRSGTCLLEDHRMAYVPVPSLLVRRGPAESQGDRRGLLLVGGVNYDRRDDATAMLADTSASIGLRTRGPDVQVQAMTRRMVWRRLPGTEDEITDIGTLYEELHEGRGRGITMLAGAQATEEAFRQHAAKSRVLHVATHGYFASPEKKSALAAADTPPHRGLQMQPQHGRGMKMFGWLGDVRGFSPGLLSGLVLAGANSPPAMPDDPLKSDDLPDDGYLTAEEIAFLPLEGVELVVLSACDTGLGEVAGGEGLLGIQRAFQVAGVETTVASLWKVDDQATCALMKLFYHKLWKENKPPIDALREAQLAVYRNPDLIGKLAGSRGPDFTKTIGLVKTRPADSVKSKRTPAKHWAGFILSDPGR